MAEVFLIQRIAGGSLRSWELKTGEQVLGRGANCEIVIDDGTISREHARLIVEDRAVRVTDLDSLNGTFVDCARIQSAEVRASSLLQFGRIVCTISYRPITDLSEYQPPSTLRYVPNTSAPDIAGLSQKKKLVLDLLLNGLSQKEIAIRLDLSPNTIHHHVTGLYRLFEVASRGELLALFIRK